MIEIAKDHRPSKHHNIHSYYEKTRKDLTLFQYPCFVSDLTIGKIVMLNNSFVFSILDIINSITSNS